MVYVDEALRCLRNSRWPYKYAAHLVADSRDELHRFAAILGLKRDWFQDKTLPHYDVTSGVRRKAIQLGAIPIDCKQMANLIRLHRTCK